MLRHWSNFEDKFSSELNLWFNARELFRITIQEIWPAVPNFKKYIQANTMS